MPPRSPPTSPTQYLAVEGATPQPGGFPGACPTPTPLPRRPRGNRPGRGRGDDGAPVDDEVRERVAQVASDLRPDVVDAIAPHAQHLRRRAERHVEGDGVLEVVADLVREVLARQADV